MTVKEQARAMRDNMALMQAAGRIKRSLRGCRRMPQQLRRKLMREFVAFVFITDPLEPVTRERMRTWREMLKVPLKPMAR